MVLSCNLMGARAQDIPAPTRDQALATQSSEEKIVLAGGCFWGVEAVFLHMKGIKNVKTGYAGGKAETATYDQVSEGNTGHAEVVEVTYDPARVTLGQILRVFFAVAHDPTQLNAQGPDHGTQYRSAIFYQTEEQRLFAADYMRELNAAKVFANPIVTTLEPLEKFYVAEPYHQNYVAFHPDNMYVMIHDLPKLTSFEATYPDLYVK